MLDRLYVALADGDLHLAKLAEAHREDLRAICAVDSEIWAIYSSSFGPGHFDASFDALIGRGGRMPYAICVDDQMVGMTAWLRPDWSAQTVAQLAGFALSNATTHSMRLSQTTSVN